MQLCFIEFLCAAYACTKNYTYLTYGTDRKLVIAMLFTVLELL